MLFLALTAKLAGQRPSELAGIEKFFDKDDAGVLDFNLACAYRLELHENERMKTQAKLIAYEVSKLFGDGGGDDSENVSDPYSDSATEVW